MPPWPLYDRTPTVNDEPNVQRRKQGAWRRGTLRRIKDSTNDDKQLLCSWRQAVKEGEQFAVVRFEARLPRGSRTRLAITRFGL